MEGVIFRAVGIGVVPYTVEIAPGAFSGLGFDDGAFYHWFSSVEFLTDEVFAGLVPAYFGVVGG